MLSDPFVIGTGGTSMTVVGSTASNFARLDSGSFIGSNIGTLDQPQYFTVTNRMNFNGVSVITLKSSEQINVAAINGVPQKDDLLEVSVQIKYPHRSATSAKVQDHVIRAAATASIAGSLDKLLRGER